MIKAYGKCVVFKSNQENPNSGIVESVGEDVKDINIGDFIYLMDYATFPINDEDEKYFVVNMIHILAIKK